MTKFEEAKKKVCALVVDGIDYTKDFTDEEVYGFIDTAIINLPERAQLSLKENIVLRREVFNALKRYDVIQEYLDDENITEIMINGYDNIFIEKEGSIYKTNKRFISREKLEDVIQQMVGSCNRTVNEASPIQDARLSSGERINVVLSPVAINGPIVTIRKFPNEPITMEKLIEFNSITPEAADFLRELVGAKYNIFISGGTGTGKTTFLNALSQYIPSDERIITIEDSAELKIQGVDNLIRLESRNKNTQECEQITIRDLIKSALRMRPDRIIVGEVRGEEAVDMLQAMNTGHDGSLSTGHGNSTKDMLARLETMVLCGTDIPLYAIRGQIASGIDILIHLGRLRNKKRVVLEISEIEGMVDGQIVTRKLYEWRSDRLEKVSDLLNKRKLLNWKDMYEL